MDRQLYLKQIDRVIEQGPYKADWDSLAARPVPGWVQGYPAGHFSALGAFLRACVPRLVRQEYLHQGFAGV